jgi:hypothetical protein
MGRFAGWVLDRYIAPRASDFTSAEIPDMSSDDPQPRHWVDSHFLNNVLRGSLDPRLGAYVVQYLRRAEAAHAEHARAREKTLAVLKSEVFSPSRYSVMLLHWEFFLAQAWQAYALLGGFIGAVTHSDHRIFRAGDRSVEQRLNSLYNATKHSDSRIANGQIPDGTVSPVWITNVGIEATEVVLTFAETGEILSDLAKWANILSDARSISEKVRMLGIHEVPH